MTRILYDCMLKNILGTTLARISIAIFSFCIVVINARYLGAVHVGTIGLIVLAISINMIMSSIVGGSSLAFLVPRHAVFLLFIASYGWALITSALGSVLLSYLHMVPAGFTFDVFFISLFQSLMNINITILLGKEKIKLYNVFTFGEMVLRITFLLLFIFYFGILNPHAFVYALYLSLGIFFIISLVAVHKYLVFTDLMELPAKLREMFRLGTYIQLAGIFQLFNYRLSYYIIEGCMGRAALGVYSVGVQISESVWLIGKSAAMVQYSRISNSDDEEYARQITLMFVKFTFLLTLLAVIVLLLIPSDVFSFVFAKDFSGLGIVISSMAVGIISLAVSMMFSHYFSGKGKPHHNTVSSGIGLVFTLGLGIILIPRYGLLGAGITASVSYTISMLYQFFVFVRIARVKLRNFLPDKQDKELLLREIRLLFNKKQNSVSVR
ncbi:MAG: polysaccharide biosynthesis C-terminal domain-containing protein [Lentimicrobiaceae bacterium]|nr:polysaccharide biosynthesis C-terminal domain-containing protein [Lentimicrobiaceae bacterium]